MYTPDAAADMRASASPEKPEAHTEPLLPSELRGRGAEAVMSDVLTGRTREPQHVDAATDTPHTQIHTRARAPVHMATCPPAGAVR